MKTMLTLLALALPLWASAQTQTIWRCGADGRSYSATPCGGGRTVEVTPARPAADVQAAQQVASREQRLADSLHQQRMSREAAERGTALAGFRTGAAAARHDATSAPTVAAKGKPLAKKKPEANGTWRATALPSRRAKG